MLICNLQMLLQWWWEVPLVIDHVDVFHFQSDYGTTSSGRQSTATLSSIPARMKDTGAGSHSKGLRALNRTLTMFDDPRQRRRGSLPSTLLSGLAKNITLSQSGSAIFLRLCSYQCSNHCSYIDALASGHYADSRIWQVGGLWVAWESTIFHKPGIV